MNLAETFHMVAGDGESSYAKNSVIQEKAVFEEKSLIEEAMNEILKPLLEKLVVADLGCSSGPNTFLLLDEIINIIDEQCRRSSQKKPEIQFFLNDLHSNDFNHVFQLSASFEKKIREEKGDDFKAFYVIGLPGSFYGRLFPSKSVNFFHSSYSLMWLSQVPRGLDGENGAQLNGTSIYISEKSSSIVPHLYLEQFQRDFSNFLKLRSIELVFGGRMVVSILGRKECPSIGDQVHVWGLLADALNDMVFEGIVKEDKLNAFNIPLYAPLLEEVRYTINMEGSFHLDQVQAYETNWDPLDKSTNDFVEDKILSGKNIAKFARAIMEPILTSHFGSDIMDDLFSRYAKNVTKHIKVKKPKVTVFILSLKLKEGYQVVCNQA